MVSYFNAMTRRSFVTGGGLATTALSFVIIFMVACGSSARLAPAEVDTPHTGSVDYGGSGGPDGGGESLDGGGLGGGGLDPLEFEDWDIVEFTDPRDSSVYDIIDGRAIIAFTNPPELPEVDPNYFDEEIPEDDPVYGMVTYYYELTALENGMTQVNDPAVAAFLAAENLEVYSEWVMVGGMAVILPEGQTVADAVQNWPGEYPDLIEVVDPDAVGSTCSFPDDPPNDFGFQFQWYLHDDDSGGAYGFPRQRYSADIEEAWVQRDLGSTNRVVAVLDTGVDYQSRDLQLSSTYRGVNTGDKRKSTQFRPRSQGGGEPWTWLMDRSQAYASALGHGTCVAGTIGAVVNNDSGTPYDDRDIAGIVPNARYLPVAIKSKGYGDPPKGSVSMSAMLNALSAVGAVKRFPAYRPASLYGSWIYVPWYNIEVVNMSLAWKGWGNRVGNRHLNYLGRYILFIAAAGNNGRNTGGYWPACHGNIMAVAAHDASGARSVWGPGSSSNYQSYVDISAPGTNLWSTDMVGNTPVHNYYRGYLPSPYHVRTNFGGTSGASPVVAGVAILVTSKWPSLWPQLVRWRITSTASFDLPDPNVNQFGRVDADSAL